MGIHPLSRIPAISLPLVVRCSHYATRAPRLPRILPPITILIQPTRAHLSSFCSFAPVFPYTSPIYSPGFSASLVEFFAGSLPLPDIYNIQRGPRSSTGKVRRNSRTERAVSLFLILLLVFVDLPVTVFKNTNSFSKTCCLHLLLLTRHFLINVPHH